MSLRLIEELKQEVARLEAVLIRQKAAYEVERSLDEAEIKRLKGELAAAPAAPAQPAKCVHGNPHYCGFCGLVPAQPAEQQP